MVRQPARRRVPPDAVLAETATSPTHLVLDLDPPAGDEFRLAVAAAHLVRQALADAGLAGAVKTSGAKGVHVFVPIDARRRSRTSPRPPARWRPGPSGSTRPSPPRRSSWRTATGKVFVDSTRAGGATVVAAYSPRLRPGAPVSFPWPGPNWTGSPRPTSRCAPRSELLGAARPWAEPMPAPQRLPADLIEEGRTIPVARVQAMHEGKRRARARRTPAADRPPEADRG